MKTSPDPEAEIPPRKRGGPVQAGIALLWAAAGIVLGILLFYHLRGPLMMVFFSLVLACGLDPMVTWLSGRSIPFTSRKVPRALAALAAVVLLVLILVSMAGIVGWFAWKEGRHFLEQIPTSEEALIQKVDTLREQFPAIPPGERVASILRSQVQEVSGFLKNSAFMIINAAGAVGSGLVIAVLTLYMLVDRHRLHQAFLALVPPDHRDLMEGTAKETLHVLGGWLRGQAVLMGTMGTIIGTAMMLFGLPYPLLLGLIGALGELVPMVGPIAAGLCVLPVALLTQPPWVTGAIVVFFLAIAVLEGNYIVPKIMQANVNLPPFFTVLAVMIGAALMGLPGAFLAIPFSAGLRVILRRLAIPAIQKSGKPSVATPDLAGK